MGLTNSRPKIKRKKQL